MISKPNSENKGFDLTFSKIDLTIVINFKYPQAFADKFLIQFSFDFVQEILAGFRLNPEIIENFRNSDFLFKKDAY